MSQYENDEGYFKLWMDEGIPRSILSKYQVRYDPFSNRIVFPIRYSDGSIIGISGRTLDPNYKQNKESKYIYLKGIGCTDFLFGYSEHKKAFIKNKEIILFEGAKSVMKIEGWGVENTAAILTSHLDSLQLPVLIKLGVKTVFALDKEVDITKDENIKKLKRYVKVEYIKDRFGLLNDKDAPVDKGFDVWERLYNERIPLN